MSNARDLANILNPSGQFTSKGIDDNADAVALTIDSSENITINSGNLTFGTASKGIYLGVTSPTASNLLDDYEEGTFDVVIRDATTGGNTGSATQTNKYVKIGSFVWMQFNLINITTTGMTGGNNLYLTGLPFTPATGSYGSGSVIVNQVNTDTNVYDLNLFQNAGQSYASFLQNVDNKFSRSDSATTWSFSVQKDLSEDVMLYAAAATGYKAGGFNSTSGDTGDMRAFDKTETTNFEVGIKSRLMNNKVQLNATAFSMDTDGQHYITQSPTGTGTIVGNATETAERLGFDLNVVAKLTSNLTLNMSYFTVNDGSPDILSNAAARLTPDDAYTIGLSHQE